MRKYLLPFILCLLLACSGNPTAPSKVPDPPTSTTTGIIKEPPAPTLPPAPIFPPPPSHQQVITATMTFQGLTVTCPEIGGSQPWFEPQIGTVSASCQQAVYEAKHAQGDTAILIDVTTGYVPSDRSAVPQYITVVKDYSSDPKGFRALVQDAIVRGQFRVVYVFMGGDAGYDTAMRNLMTMMPVLSQAPSLLPYIVVGPGFDSIIGYDERCQCFKPWTLDQVNSFLTSAHSLGAMYESIEPNADEPVVSRLSQFISPQAWQDLDIVLTETNEGWTGQWGDGLWQNAARQLCSLWVRPGDMPAGDDPTPPCDWGPLTSRGPVQPIMFEFAEYPWVRGRISAAQLNAERGYLHGLGYVVVD